MDIKRRLIRVLLWACHNIIYMFQVWSYSTNDWQLRHTGCYYRSYTLSVNENLIISSYYEVTQLFVFVQVNNENYYKYLIIVPVNNENLNTETRLFGPPFQVYIQWNEEVKKYWCNISYFIDISLLHLSCLHHVKWFATC